MKRITTIIIFIFTLNFLSSCGEESLTTGTITVTEVGTKIQSFDPKKCESQSRFINPPVDILFVVDNTKSTNKPTFQNIKSQIQNTVNTISNEFDYHIYVAPLLSNGEDIKSYPLILNNPSSIENLALVNNISAANLQFFSIPTGANKEKGFTRAHDIIQANRANGIFRNNADTIIVMISNGYDTESMIDIGETKFFSLEKYLPLKQKLIALKDSLNAKSFRFLSLVAHSDCNGFEKGENYIQMSSDIYNSMGYNDDPRSNSYDLCGQNFDQLFSSVNKSIKKILVGHRYNHWLVTTAKAESIQEDDITIVKVLANKTQVKIPKSSINGFTYLEYKENFPTRYYPDEGEPVTGLVVKLNGNAEVTYPECIIAKTRTPTEYFGFVALTEEPDVDTIKVQVRGEDISKSTENGWSYIGYSEIKNIKVVGPGNTPIEPPLNKSGYFIKLHGNAIYTNGEAVSVSYKPKRVN